MSHSESQERSRSEPSRMKSIRCLNRMCGEQIAIINGNVPAVTCKKCGKTRRLYHDKKSRAITLTIKTQPSS